MRTILNIPLGKPEQAGRARVIAATILRAADERQPFCTAVHPAFHGDVLVVDCTFPWGTFDPDILARAGVAYGYVYWPSIGEGFTVTSRLGTCAPEAIAWSAERFRLLDGTFLALSRTVTPAEAPAAPDEAAPISIATHTDIPWQRVTDLIITAIETPWGDWVSSIDNANPAVREGDGDYGADSIWYANPRYWQRGFSAEIEHDRHDGEGTQSFCLNRESIARGLAVMAKHQPNQFADFLNENEDAGTADTFLQCCVFADYVEQHGDVVFG